MLSRKDVAALPFPVPGSMRLCEERRGDETLRPCLEIKSLKSRGVTVQCLRLTEKKSHIPGTGPDSFVRSPSKCSCVQSTAKCWESSLISV